MNLSGESGGSSFCDRHNRRIAFFTRAKALPYTQFSIHAVEVHPDCLGNDMASTVMDLTSRHHAFRDLSVTLDCIKGYYLPEPEF